MDSTEKFSGKVSEYVKYRPEYPAEFINYLIKDVGISQNSILADIGAGTGKLTKQLANYVQKIYAIEPNLPMRTACIEYCSIFKNFTPVDGRAEDTGLPDKSVDFITVAQAFHWFDRTKTKLEFQRILRPQGKVILIWNTRVSESELVQENEAILKKLCPDFKGYSGDRDLRPEAYSDFFQNGACDYKIFDNDQLLNLESFIGSNLSASYAPSVHDNRYSIFVQALTGLFHKYSHHDQLFLPNKTHSYVGEV